MEEYEVRHGEVLEGALNFLCYEFISLISLYLRKERRPCYSRYLYIYSDRYFPFLTYITNLEP